MRLHIRAYSGIEPVNEEEVARNEHGDNGKYIIVTGRDVQNLSFPGLMDGLTSDFYTFSEEGRCCMGGSFYYQPFLDTLEKFSNDEFSPIIEFGECEGFFDTETCRSLADVFSNNEEKYTQFLKRRYDNQEVEFELARYVDMKDMFLLGSDNGCVQFLQGR